MLQVPSTVATITRSINEKKMRISAENQEISVKVKCKETTNLFIKFEETQKRRQSKR